MSGIRIVQGPIDSNVQECVMANSADFDFMDPVTINSGGFLAVAAAGERIVGTWAEDGTVAASDNQTVGLVKGKYDPIDLSIVYEGTSDQACVQTDVGAYADFAVAAGAFTINLSAGTSGQVFVKDFDPDRDGSTTKVRFTIAEPQDLAYAQA